MFDVRGLFVTTCLVLSVMCALLYHVCCSISVILLLKLCVCCSMLSDNCCACCCSTWDCFYVIYGCLFHGLCIVFCLVICVVSFWMYYVCDLICVRCSMVVEHCSDVCVCMISVCC